MNTGLTRARLRVDANGAPRQSRGASWSTLLFSRRGLVGLFADRTRSALSKSLICDV
jgi:hypothetical protein